MQAYALLHMMRGTSMNTDMISFSATISAWEKGGQYEQALALFDEMRETRMAANLFSPVRTSQRG